MPCITIAGTTDCSQPGALARIHVCSVSAAGDSGRPRWPERKVDAGLNYRPHGGEPSLVEQFPNDVFPPERHTGPGECSMEDQ